MGNKDLIYNKNRNIKDRNNSLQELLSSFYKEETGISIHPVIETFLSYTKEMIAYGIDDKEWIEIKQKEFLMLLAHYYSPQKLSRFLYPLLKNDPFRNMIKRSLPHAESVDDFLKISGMKRTTFEKKFKREFGTSPYKWILDHKALLVKSSLATTTLSIREISKMYNFNSGSHFTRFCRQQFGMPPSELRKRLRLDSCPDKTSR